jgi:hypothetical protein
MLQPNDFRAIAPLDGAVSAPKTGIDRFGAIKPVL